MTKRKLGALIATVAVAAGAVGGAVVLTSGATADDGPRPLAQSSELPSVISEAIAQPGSEVNEYGLIPAASRKFPLHSSTGDGWLTPGKTGMCLWEVDGAGSCASNEAAAKRGLVLTLMQPTKQTEPHQPVFPDQSAFVTLIGHAPEGVTSVAIMDPDGVTLARTAVVDTFYDFHIPIPEAGAQLRLQRPGDEPITLSLGATR